MTVLKDFETVLMFYGYDLSVDMVSATPMNASTAGTDVANTTIASNATAEEMQEETTTSKEMETTTGLPSTTTESAEETTIVPTTTTTTTTTTSTTTEEATTTTEAEAVDTEATPAAAASGEAEESTTEAAAEDDAAELVSAFVAEEDAEPFLRIQKARVSRLPTSKLQAPLKHSNPITPKPIYLPSARIAVMPMMARQVTAPMQRKATTVAGGARQAPASTTALPATGTARRAKMARHKRHVLGYKDLDANLFVALFSPHTPHAPPPLHSLPVPATAGFAHITNEFEPHYIGDGSESKTNYNADVISHVFYLGSQQVVHTTFKVYNAVLYYKYFDHLKLSVLELELDTPEYNLMILLPDYHMDIVAAAAALKLGPTLRLMRKQLKPRWVQAIIPDFKLHGTMFLTNDLQNVIPIPDGLSLLVHALISISFSFSCRWACKRQTARFPVRALLLSVSPSRCSCDIFEPNRADFRPMTDEKGVYVRHIEQSIDVNIRTHPINQLKRKWPLHLHLHLHLHLLQHTSTHSGATHCCDCDRGVGSNCSCNCRSRQLR